ncbi:MULTISPECIES: acetyl-CoA carboxylase subunit [Corynebacterium]|jgi:hypothetical protein|nr:acetyl-CoA carboxylase subunit [Corynebacterium neomassiliense]MCI1256407.1 acetyl-CoA carboxylase subunit [Corynebacterium provencense]
MTDNPPVPVTVLRGLPGADPDEQDRVARAVSLALTSLAGELSSSAGRYEDPREALRRDPRGAWGVPGVGRRNSGTFSPAGFRA